MKTINKFYGIQGIVLVLLSVLAFIAIPFFIKVLFFLAILFGSCYISYKLGRKYDEEKFNLKQFAEKQSEKLNDELDELLKKRKIK